MGSFEVEIEIGDGDGMRWERVLALVDTGSTYTWVPRRILAELGINPEFEREFETADGRVVLRDMAEARVRLDSQTRHSPVVFADGGDAILLGVVTLEVFGLGVDPVNQRLIRVRGLAMPASPLP